VLPVERFLAWAAAALDTASPDRPAAPYDLVLLDPPYTAPELDQVLGRLGEAPILAPDGAVAVEHAARRALAPCYGRLALWTCRRYGDSAFSLYLAAAGPGEDASLTTRTQQHAAAPGR